MAERRMFAKSIVLSDAFLDMPMSARCLYFTLSMLADDDGFVGSPKAIMRQCGASQNDLDCLFGKRYVLGFESGIIVIKHWRINNYLQSDRKKNTTYVEEMNQLTLDAKGAYTEKEIMYTENGNLYTENQIPVYTGKYSIDKSSIDKSSIEECIPPSDKPKRTPKNKYGEYGHVLLTPEEYDKLHIDYPDKANEAIKFLDEYIEMKGYKAKSHYLCIRKWVIDALKEREQKKQKSSQAAKNCGTASAQRYNNYMHHDYSDDQLKSMEKMLLATSGSGRG